MERKNIKRVSVSVQADMELTDSEISEKKQQLREYAKRLFNARDTSVNLTFEQIE